MRLVDKVFKKLVKNMDLSLGIQHPEGAMLDLDELTVSQMVPYDVHYDDETVQTTDDALVQVLKIDGLMFDSLSAQQIKMFEQRRNTVLRTVASSDLAIYAHVIRRKIYDFPDGEGGTWFSRTLNKALRKRYASRGFYVNEIYISLVRRRFRGGVPGLLDRGIALITGNSSSQNEEESLERMADGLYKASNLVMRGLSDYGVKRLRIQRHPVATNGKIDRETAYQSVKRFLWDWDNFKENLGDHEEYAEDEFVDYLGEEFCEISSFFNYLINLSYRKIPVTELAIKESLPYARLNFRILSNMCEVRGNTDARIGAMLSMGEWPRRTPSRMMDKFMQQPVEFIITQSFFFLNRIESESAMMDETRRITVADPHKISEDDSKELTEGIRALRRGDSVNGAHHLTIFIHVPSLPMVNDENRKENMRTLDHAVGLVEGCFVDMNVKPVREWFAMETFFWSQLPGQQDALIGRRGKIKSGNFAGFVSLHNFARGRREGNLWGHAITAFETESGTQYNFNFHREMEGMVAGHMGLSADTGSGKTTLLAELVSEADKAFPVVYWFDNKFGAKVFMKAMGGVHTLLSPHACMHWNPFKLPDTPQNRAYLVDLQILMRECYASPKNPTTEDHIKRFKNAVDENYDLPFVDRRLRNIVWTYGNGELADSMAIWHGAKGITGANAGVFDNENDNIDLTKSRHYCFEMMELLKNQEARPELAVVMSYPLHRIELAMDGRPFILVLEEGQNLVKNEFWRKRIDSFIMQIRRKNGILIFVTPDAKYFHSETDSIDKQTVTKIYLANDTVKDEDHQNLTVVEREWLRKLDPKERKFLIRRGQESIRACFDLSSDKPDEDLSDFIPVLSSNDVGVALMESIIERLGTDEPSVWVPVFMQEAKAKNTHNLRAVR
ncbi:MULTISPECIES: type VI secretion protein [Pseudomonas]|uniref:ATPase required for both assembly of type IV secretion complex and secretion of T-DNA complex, VirB4 n=1 Tax=Pseudomonas syringae pv. actinidiae TaxID=103796 RepID=A0A2P0QF22_PSESF|nr:MULTISPECIES: type VI secretion protein [Pseudomonas]ARO44974.1 ATPase required for both assembly of type IV secretion complex and secretion of T-DNA complex, VirB4 [Pseudomonas syringae pv. actinidiae]ARO45079.1 ATPase required for both assembly of type IV secretion complex and secretion of T-DNA complex, VirB4 [Pseudomonas syringae pv. actinidiae]ARO45170.1 ATPase required for both assembly of type IV secretion complex and secretion of T-DNA complex, VirB4 [Pseudomonas syringae pv. actinidi